MEEVDYNLKITAFQDKAGCDNMDEALMYLEKYNWDDKVSKSK